MLTKFLVPMRKKIREAGGLETLPYSSGIFIGFSPQSWTCTTDKTADEQVYYGFKAFKIETDNYFPKV